jgi:hypothetical protein
MATAAIEFFEEVAPSVELWCLGQIIVMARTARTLNEMGRQNGLFPGEGCFMRFSDFSGRALAAMANDAPPFLNMVGYRWVSAEWLRHGGRRESRLGNALVTCGAAVHDAHLREPDLIDTGIDIGQ